MERFYFSTEEQFLDWENTPENCIYAIQDVNGRYLGDMRGEHFEKLVNDTDAVNLLGTDEEYPQIKGNVSDYVLLNTNEDNLSKLCIIIIGDKLNLINGDLAFAIEKIIDMDIATISTAYDGNLDYPYAIDVEDSSFFYSNEADRNKDFYALYIAFNRVNNINFINPLPQFELTTSIKFVTGEKLSADNDLDLNAYLIEKEYSIYYISYNHTDVLESIEESNTVGIELYHIVDLGIFIAIN